jgi:hypothetical protein
VPDAIFYRPSLRTSYRFTHAFWVVCSALYLVVYLFLADLDSDRTHGLLLAFTILLPAVFVPFYIWRANFATPTEAVIRSVAPGLALSGLPATLLRLADRFHQPGNGYEHGRLQAGYISVVLLLLGLASGIELGMLRWKFLEESRAAANLAGPQATWRRYIKSGTLWIAGAMVCAWVVALFPSVRAADALAYVGIVLAGSGLLLIAPISVYFATGPAVSIGKRVWKYWLKCLYVGLGLLALCFLVSTVLAKNPLIIVYFIYWVPYFLPGFWLLCLPWAVLSGLAEQPGVRQTEQTRSPLAPWLPQLLPGPATWKVLLLGLAAQPFILLPALWTTSPWPLGLHGIGCVEAHYTNPAEYWFRRAYKGIGSHSEVSNRLIYRLAANPHVCGVIDREDLLKVNDPKQVTIGYANAVRAWLWLIDGDQWDGPRSKEIRQELTLLLGREFSCYQELKDWWNQNNKRLVWSGRNELLEVHEPTISDMAHRYYTLTSMSPVETIRLHSYQLEPGPATDALHAGQLYTLSLFDREERLRGLKLAAADQIAILSGQRERNAREFLERLTGRNFATKADWQNFFSGNPPAPWNMSRESAQSWIGLIYLYGKTEPYHTRYLADLREATGLNYSAPEDYIPWLQNPDHTRQQEWLKARELADDLPDANPHGVRDTMFVLKIITDQSFGSPATWVKWWQENHSTVSLSSNGRKLTVERYVR